MTTATTAPSSNVTAVSQPPRIFRPNMRHVKHGAVQVLSACGTDHCGCRLRLEDGTELREDNRGLRTL